MKKRHTRAVSIYMSPKVHKLVHIEAIRTGTTMGDLVGEAILAWLKENKKKEMEERRLRNELADIDKLEQEYKDTQKELNLLLKEREAKR